MRDDRWCEAVGDERSMNRRGGAGGHQYPAFPVRIWEEGRMKPYVADVSGTNVW